MTVLEWKSATEWDNAQSESDVVHENFGDHDAGTVEIGYPSDYLSTKSILYWPCDEDSAGTINDVAGTYDGSYRGGPTFNQTGILNTTGIQCDATDDHLYRNSGDIPGPSTSGFTILFWVKPNSVYSSAPSNNKWVCDYWVSGNDRLGYFIGSGDGDARAYLKVDGTPYETIATGDPMTTGWNSLAIRAADNTLDIRLNKTTEASSSPSVTIANMGGPGDFVVNEYDPTGPAISYEYGATYSEVFLFDDYLSDAEVDAFHDLAAAGTGSLTTAKKTS